MVIPCPNCKHDLRVRPDYIGGSLRCKFCAEKFRVSGPEDIRPGAPAVPASDPSIAEAHQAPQGAAGSKDETRGTLTDLDDKMHQRLASLEAEVHRLSGELSETVASRSQTVTELEEAREHLQRLQEESAHYQRELAHFRSSESMAAQREQDLSAANDRILELQNQLQETDLLRGRLDRLEVERAQLDRDWQDERERLRASFQEEQRVRLQELEAGWQEERVRLEQQRENLARERDRAIEEVRAFDHAGKVQEIDSLRAQLAKAQCERNELENAWRQEKQRLLAEAEEELARRQAEYEERLLSGQEARKQAEMKRETVTAAYERLQKEMVILSAEHDALKEQVANPEQDVDRPQQNREEVTQEIEHRLPGPKPLLLNARVLQVTAGRSFVLDEEWAVTEIIVPMIVHNPNQESVSAWSLHSNFHVGDPSRFLTKNEFEPLASSPYFHGLSRAILPAAEKETGTIIGFKIQRREPLSFQVFYHLSGVSLTYMVISDNHVGEVPTVALKDFFDSTPLVDQIKASLREAEVTFTE
jgi:DNA-binding transcriptional regulator YhcF (GntR family)